MKLLKLLSLLVGFIALIPPSFASEEDKLDMSKEFPGREKYPDVQIIELNDLYAKRNDVIIIDARSSYEFDTLRIKGALNIALSSKTYGEELQKLRTEHPGKTFVFYCNGKTCLKSYKAVRQAVFYKIDNVVAFDAGIFDWAKSYPGDAELLGESPINPKHLISKADFTKRLLAPAEFGTRVGAGTMVLDVRDLQQREAIGFFPGYERRVGLDDKKTLLKYINRAKEQGKTLLIYDEVGHQVRWLQYTLEQAGLQNYYFMDGGAKGYYEMLAKQ